jgi:hypothetical protein
MTAELQQIVAIVIVALAAASLLWRITAPWVRGQKASGCSTGCGQCPANQSAGQSPSGLPLVQIQLSKPQRKS